MQMKTSQAEAQVVEELWYHSMQNQKPTDITVNSEPYCTIQGHDHPTKHRSRPWTEEVGRSRNKKTMKKRI
jgi:hypothetical protein